MKTDREKLNKTFEGLHKTYFDLLDENAILKQLLIKRVSNAIRAGIEIGAYAQDETDAEAKAHKWLMKHNRPL